MKRTRRTAIAALLALLLATSALAQQSPKIERSHNPRLVGTAVLINIVYVPFRLVLLAAGGVLGGVTGLITLGDLAAAESMWGLTDGSAVVTPEMLEGTEEFHFSAYD
jgi:hypothetical protein